jgi:hypothetical protein
MQKSLMIVLASLCAGLCKGQFTTTNTLKINAVVSAIDSAEKANATLSRYIVRKYMHNETKVDYEFLLDTSTQHIYKCDYVTRTLQNSKDTILEKFSFFVYSNQFVALRYQELQNNKVVNTQIFYLESDSGKVQKTYPVKGLGTKALTWDEINYKATELWLGAEALKEMLSKRKSG